MLDSGTSELFRTFWPRLWAGLVDALVFLPLSWLDDAIWERSSSIPILVTWFLLNSFAFTAYSVLLHGIFGQTVGKRATSVKVLDISGAPLGMKQAALRDSVPFALIVLSVALSLPSVSSGQRPFADIVTFSDLGTAALLSLLVTLGWFVAEIVTMLSNAKRRAIHDFIAGSVVVRFSAQPTEQAQRRDAV